MNKKTIIQLVIIVVAFGAAGLVLYNGFFGNNNVAVQPVGGGSSLSTTTPDILPYGSALDFSKVLDPNRFQYNQISYPQLDPQNEVGISPDSLIVPSPITQPAQ